MSTLNPSIIKTSRLPDHGPLEISNEKEFFQNLKLKFEATWQNPYIHNEKLTNFKQLTLLGRGTFGQVILVQHTLTNNFYAMKALEKRRIVKYKQVQHIKNEKDILQSLDFPFTVYLVCYFIDNSYLYLIMPFMSGGELYYYLKKRKVFMEKEARFFVGQCILALEYLHYVDLVYRDLKPENIVLDHTGYAKLTDFGFCKHLKDSKRTYTLCGTPNYLAPEIILNKGYGKSVDWWGIGILVFELVSGLAPFDSKTALEIYEKIIANKYKMPRFFTEELKDLVDNILQTDLSKRFGNLKDGVDDIKQHKWFKDLNWLALLNRKLDAPFRPKYDFSGDCSNFEDASLEFKGLKVAHEDQYHKEFEDFYFDNNNTSKT